MFLSLLSFCALVCVSRIDTAVIKSATVDIAISSSSGTVAGTKHVNFSATIKNINLSVKFKQFKLLSLISIALFILHIFYNISVVLPGLQHPGLITFLIDWIWHEGWIAMLAESATIGGGFLAADLSSRCFYSFLSDESA